jgi:hypothetical protein
MTKRRTSKRPAQPEVGITEAPEQEAPAPTPVDHLDLADGWTREQVIHALIVRVHRDSSYLAFRKATNRRNGYDAQIQQDMRALSLAAVWLQGDREEPEDVDVHGG